MLRLLYSLKALDLKYQGLDGAFPAPSRMKTRKQKVMFEADSDFLRELSSLVEEEFERQRITELTQREQENYRTYTERAGERTEYAKIFLFKLPVQHPMQGVTLQGSSQDTAQAVSTGAFVRFCFQGTGGHRKPE